MKTIPARKMHLPRLFLHEALVEITPLQSALLPFTMVPQARLGVKPRTRLSSTPLSTIPIRSHHLRHRSTQRRVCGTGGRVERVACHGSPNICVQRREGEVPTKGTTGFTTPLYQAPHMSIRPVHGMNPHQPSNHVSSRTPRLDMGHRSHLPVTMVTIMRKSHLTTVSGIRNSR
jgi:hypothetical protein